MRKMLAIIGSFVLCGTASAAVPDRSTLSFEENAIINSACAGTLSSGNGAFQSCVADQIAALAKHPTPDRSGLSPSRNHAIEAECHYLQRQGIGPYNDCVAKAIATPVKTTETSPVDELSPDFGKAFTEATNDTKPPEPVQVAAASGLPGPSQILPTRPDHLGQQTLAPQELFKKVEHSVFVVLATQSFAEAKVRNISQGSAIAVSDHLLLTNCHVVKGRSMIKLIQDGKRADATLVGGDYATDRCVLKTDEMTLTPVNGVRSVESIGVGEHVFAIGAPLSMELTFSDGMISGVRHGSSRNLVQTTAAVGHGSSGGGLFDDRGNLIGITTLMFGATGLVENLNFAIAASDFWK